MHRADGVSSASGMVKAEDEIGGARGSAGELGESHQVEAVGIVERPGGDTRAKSNSAQQAVPDAACQNVDGFARLEDDPAALGQCRDDRDNPRVEVRTRRAGRGCVRLDLPKAQRACGQGGVDVGLGPAAAEGRGKGKRIGGGQPIGPRADEERVKCQGAGPAAVVASMGMNVHDHPRAALKAKREEALGRAPAGGWLAEPLANGFQLGQPFGTAARRAGQHGVSPMPEREATVDGLFESDFRVQRDHERETWLPRHSLTQGRLSVGIWKSEANTKVVFPPLVGVMVPDKTLIARGSPCWLWST